MAKCNQLTPLPCKGLMRSRTAFSVDSIRWSSKSAISADRVDCGCWYDERVSRWADEGRISWTWGAWGAQRLKPTTCNALSGVKCDSISTATVNFASCSVPSLLTTWRQRDAAESATPWSWSLYNLLIKFERLAGLW